MKKTILAVIVIGMLASAPVIADTMMGNSEMGPGMMTETRQQTTNAPNREYPRHMMNEMRYNNYGMMGGGFGMPQCSAGEGHHMMGQYGMMPMMGSFGMMHGQGTENFKKYAAFMKETRELRKKLHNLMFNYGEARWNPDTTLGELNKMAEEINKLRQDIHQKMPQ